MLYMAYGSWPDREAEEKIWLSYMARGLIG